MLNTQNSTLITQNLTHNTPFGLYVHVPFCAAKCPYCDFYSGRDVSRIPAYVDAVVAELCGPVRAKAFADGRIFERPLASVYFGGGTPSLLSAAQVKMILDTVRARYALTGDAEVTLELNPTLNEPEAYFAALASAGVNRVSIGMQSAVAQERRALGRRGTPEDVRRAVTAAQSAGVTNVSVDLMLGIPGQTQDTLRQSLDFALGLGITHLSVYLLKIEPGTVFEKRRDRLDLPDEDAAADLYLYLCAYLRERGMRHYEVSNFCFGSAVGRHNLSYWLCGEYLGVGPAAHSFLNGRRFYYARDLDAFLAGAPPADDGAGGDADEVLLLALRTDLGLDLPAFCRRFGLQITPALTDQLEQYRTLGMLEYTDGCISLTDRGFLLSNAVISGLLAAF